jgi:flagellar hook-associated protein 3 FlgL
MTRVASFAQQALIQDTITHTQERIFERQAQVASGKQSDDFAGISGGANLLITFKAAGVRAESFIRQNQQLESRLQIADGTLSGLGDVASTLKARIIQHLNDATGPASVLAQDAALMLSTAVGLLNTQVSGRFLFGGTRTDAPPVAEPVPDPAAFGVPDDNYYQGDSNELFARVSETQEVRVGIAGNRNGFQQLIGAFKAAIEGHNTGDTNMIESALDMVTTAIADINTYRAELGSASNLIARATSLHQDVRLYADSVIGEVENVDVPSAVAALSADQAALEASFMTVARLSTLSLADYLR